MCASVASIISHAVMAKPRMLGAEALRQAADDVVVGARLGMGLDHLARHLQEGVAAGGVDVVMLEERRRRQHDVGHGGGLGQELLVHADEEIVARQAVAHFVRFRRHDHRVGVLHQHRRHRRPVAEIAPVAGQDRRRCATGRARGSRGRAGRAPRSACGRADRGRALRIERAAAPILPGAGDGRQAARGEELRRAVAAARKAVADADIAALGAAVERARRRRSRRPAMPVIAAAQAGSRRARCARAPCGSTV